MSDIELTYRTAIPLLIAAVMAIATLLRVLAAHADRTALMSARARGMYTDEVTLKVVMHAMRREWLRIGKHLVIIASLIIGFTNYMDAEARNWAFVILSILMGINSLLDKRVQDFAMSHRAPELPRRATKG